MELGGLSYGYSTTIGIYNSHKLGGYDMYIYILYTHIYISTEFTGIAQVDILQ